MKKQAIRALTSVIILVAVLGMIGSLIPRGQFVSHAIYIQRPPEVIWEVITDFPASPGWRSDLYEIEDLKERDGFQLWREISRFGKYTCQVKKMSPPNRLVISMLNGTFLNQRNWVCEIIPDGNLSLVRMTRNGYIENPLFRIMAQFAGNHDELAIKSYLNDLKRKIEES